MTTSFVRALTLLAVFVGLGLMTIPVGQARVPRAPTYKDYVSSSGLHCVACYGGQKLTQEFSCTTDGEGCEPEEAYHCEYNGAQC